MSAFSSLPYGDSNGYGEEDTFRRTGWASKGSRPRPPLTGPDRAYARRMSPDGGRPSSAEAVGAMVAKDLATAYAKYHAVAMEQIEKRGAADQLVVQARMTDLDARAAFRAAEQELEAGQDQISQVGLEGAQRRSAITASAAARGVDSSSGSGAEVQASQRLVEAIDVYNISLGSIQAANAQRRQAVALRNEALMARVSARNLRRTAKYAQPEAALIIGALNTFGGGYSAATS